MLFHLCLVFGFVTSLVAGVFQSFSDFVMSGLVRARPAGGMESMQQLNRTVFRSVFLFCLLALVPLTVLFALFVGSATGGVGRVLVAAAALIYVVCVFFVTVFGNVPMNQRLDRLSPFEAASETHWANYTRDWTRWNHVRTLGGAVSAALFLVAAAWFGTPT